MEPLPPDYITPLRGDHLTAEALEAFNNGLDSFQLMVLGLEVCGKVADPKHILELGLRMVSGCGAVMNVEVFESKMLDITQNKLFDRVARASAFSLLAYGYRHLAFYNAETPGGPPVILHLCAGAQMANGAAMLGLFSRATMAVGQAFEDAGYRRNRRDALVTLPANRSNDDMLRWVASFATFWRGFDIRKRAFDRKVIPKPDEEKVACSAGCGIVASKANATKRCAGKCPLRFKPMYCSKSCQKLDWARHKAICRENITEEEFHAVPAPSYTDDEILASLPPEPSGATAMLSPGDVHKDVGMFTMSTENNFSNEYSIDVPDGDSLVRMYSQTTSTDEMKRMKILAQRSADTNVYIGLAIESSDLALPAGALLSPRTDWSDRRRGRAIFRVRMGYSFDNGIFYPIHPSTKFNMETMQEEPL
ncbi:zinc finger MYND domain-containing protein [Phanerochaete sordida]|uniref:Zinc finger MYND domain-containing protein n=1 Tax=Phanerochaete sordida TaxID=48140 RepID=A0A9P3GQ44_9APHY|nr:zinc finger MYND domain-containing protein [Phanerochaete sordida]